MRKLPNVQRAFKEGSVVDAKGPCRSCCLQRSFADEGFELRILSAICRFPGVVVGCQGEYAGSSLRNRAPES